MISHGGALGDNGYTVPALNELRKIYDEIYLYGRKQAVIALEGTGLIDRFIVKPEEFGKGTLEQQRDWLVNAVSDVDFHAKINFNDVIPGRYMFHQGDPKFDLPVEWKRENVRGVSFFDAMSERVEETKEAIGKRPVTQLTHAERSWLRDFRHIYNIPKGAFLLGWQFTGSARIKWYPFFNEVIQQGIMSKYPQVYVIGLGDVDNKIQWDAKYHGGRFINLGRSVSFRQAYILTGIFDCLVSPETGLMVFAQCFAHVPKILLATHSYGYHFSFPETVIIQSEAKCSPCYKIVYDCEHEGDNPWSLCMGNIAPERVVEAIEKVIKEERLEVD